MHFAVFKNIYKFYKKLYIISNIILIEYYNFLHYILILNIITFKAKYLQNIILIYELKTNENSFETSSQCV